LRKISTECIATIYLDTNLIKFISLQLPTFSKI
jgi:hypothetical protein